MDAPKSLKISIMGKSYLITSDEDDELIINAAQMVDGLMKKKSEKMPLNGENRVAIVVALQLATDLLHLQSQLKGWEEEREKITSLLCNELS
jgi:cell division protein ZapA